MQAIATNPENAVAMRTVQRCVVQQNRADPVIVGVRIIGRNLKNEIKWQYIK